MLVTGVDIVEVSRLEKAIERHGDRILARFFTDQERAHCDGNVSRLAGRLAVKEAVSKALGTGIGDFRWIDLEIVPDERGRPLSDFLPRFVADVGKNDPVVVICRTGSRTDALARHLVEQMGYTQVYNVRHGISRWIGDKNSVVRN